MRNYLRIGKIISLHGIKGEVKVFPTTDDVKRFDHLKKFYIVDADDADDSAFTDKNTYETENVKYIKNTCILKIKGYDKIEDSSKFIGKNIYVERSDAIKLDANEFYIVDLIGLKCYMGQELIGNVNDIMKTKANSILVIDYRGKEVLVPMVSDFIEQIDIDKALVRIKTLEGLI